LCTLCIWDAPLLTPRALGRCEPIPRPQPGLPRHTIRRRPLPRPLDTWSAVVEPGEKPPLLPGPGLWPATPAPPRSAGPPVLLALRSSAWPSPLPPPSLGAAVPRLPPPRLAARYNASASSLPMSAAVVLPDIPIQQSSSLFYLLRN